MSGVNGFDNYKIINRKDIQWVVRVVNCNYKNKTYNLQEIIQDPYLHAQYHQMIKELNEKPR